MVERPRPVGFRGYMWHNNLEPMTTYHIVTEKKDSSLCGTMAEAVGFRPRKDYGWKQEVVTSLPEGARYCKRCMNLFFKKYP